MTDNPMLRQPMYVKLPLILLSIGMIIVLVHSAQHILVPMLIALLIAILLNPLYHFIRNTLFVPRILAIFFTVLIFISLFLGILLFVSWQISAVIYDSDKIIVNLSIHYDSLRYWLRDTVGFSLKEQSLYFESTLGNTLNGDNKIMGSTLSFFSTSLFNMVLIPIYVFLILLYQDLFTKFLFKMVQNKSHHILNDILSNVNIILKSYILGLIIQMFIVASLTSIGMFILGVEYAILIGVITALLNLIPYIGIMMAITIAFLAALINSSEISVMLGVGGLFALVQFIDNNILVPRIVGNKVRINALASIVGVITGGFIAGIAGMFLAIPLLAIMKVIFDRIESLSPWGYLIGDDQNRDYSWPILQIDKIIAKTGVTKLIKPIVKTNK
jgi:predicted PurR-regulated permease PerM